MKDLSDVVYCSNSATTVGVSSNVFVKLGEFAYPQSGHDCETHLSSSYVSLELRNSH